MCPCGEERSLRIIFLVFAFIGFFGTIEAIALGAQSQSQFQVSVPGLEDNWETQLETGLIALEANCDENYMPFNREKMRDSLKSCLRTVIAQDAINVVAKVGKNKKGSGLSQVDIFRHIYIEPICSKISQSLDCLQPHRKIIDSCAREDGKALQQLMHVSCRGNGSRLIEFLETGGVDCIVEQKDEIVSCFAIVAERKGSLTTSDEVCGYFRQSRDCLMTAFSKCTKTKPGEIIHELLEDVVKGTNGNCFKTLLLTNSGSKTHIQLIHSKSSNLLLSPPILSIILTVISKKFYI